MSCITAAQKDVIFVNCSYRAIGNDNKDKEIQHDRERPEEAERGVNIHPYIRPGLNFCPKIDK